MGASTWLRRLVLQDFRNYSWLEVETGPEPVVLTGANGAGKTNILEAISFLSPGKGLRGSDLGEIDRRGVSGVGGCWSVAAEIEGVDGPVHIGTGRMEGDVGDKRRIRIDGEEVKGQQKLAAQLVVVWLTPPMEQLFLGPAAARRKFFDRLTYGFFPEHSALLSRYEKAMRERNRLLDMGRVDASWICAVERRMAEYGAAIAAGRMESAARLNSALAEAGTHFPRGMVEPIGTVEGWLREGMSALEAEERLADVLAMGRSEDTRSGRTLTGPHRSDTQVEYSAKKQPAYACSTGEQKALMLSLVLAVARARRAWHSAAPILLLDEVAAHLDSGRRIALFDEIARLGVQAWMTGTDASAFAGLDGRAKFLDVAGNNVTSSELRMLEFA